MEGIAVLTLLRRIHKAVLRRGQYALYWISATRTSKRNLKALQGKNVLVLCYGNIYRSPFIAARLSVLLADSGWKVDSAGFHEKEGRFCDPGFVHLAAAYGADLSAHRSKHISEHDANWADAIVIMDGKNRLMLDDLEPETAKKAVWIGAWLPGLRPDVFDPYGLPNERVREIADRLSDAATSLASELDTLSQ